MMIKPNKIEFDSVARLITEVNVSPEPENF